MGFQENNGETYKVRRSGLPSNVETGFVFSLLSFLLFIDLILALFFLNYTSVTVLLGYL